MRITVNEQRLEVPDRTPLSSVRRQVKPDADVLVVNGAPVADDLSLADGDTVVLIRRGEVPSVAELEHLMAARHTPGVHARVRRACVGIAGLGGLGSAVAIALARTGVGQLVLVDFDVVEPSNLNRQQYFVDQIGRPKTEALAETLRRVNPCIEVRTHALRITAENVPLLFGRVDVLVEAFDRADQKSMLIRAVAACCPGKPVVGASGVAGHGSCGSVQVRRVGPWLYIVGDLETAAQPGTGLMAPRVGVAACMQANTVLRLLLGETEM